MASRSARNRDSAKAEGESSATDGTEGTENEEQDQDEGTDGAADSSGEDEFNDSPPAGMVRRNASDAVGWVAKFKGHRVYGVLLGRFQRASQDLDDEGNPKVRYFYQIKLVKSCKVALSQDDQTEDEKTKDAKRGDVVNLDENKALEGLNDALKEGPTQFAWVLFKGLKRQTGNRSRKYWDIDCFTEKKRSPF